MARCMKNPTQNGFDGTDTRNIAVKIGYAMQETPVMLRKGD